MPPTASPVRRTVQFSELSRSSKAVAQAADEGPVTITRRDGENLVLLRESEVEAGRLGLALAAQIIGVAVAEWPATDGFVQRLRAPFPWLEFLSDEERGAFAEEIVTTARACASVAVFDRLFTVLAAWKATAIAYAEGWTPEADEQLHWLDEPADVQRPEV